MAETYVEAWVRELWTYVIAGVTLGVTIFVAGAIMVWKSARWRDTSIDLYGVERGADLKEGKDDERQSGGDK